MTRPELLTTADVAALVGINRTQVARWCAVRRIGRTLEVDERGRRYLYPAVAVRAAHAHATQLPAELRLRRWVAKALIA